MVLHKSTLANYRCTSRRPPPQHVAAPPPRVSSHPRPGAPRRLLEQCPTIRAHALRREPHGRRLCVRAGPLFSLTFFPRLQYSMAVPRHTAAPRPARAACAPLTRMRAPSCMRLRHRTVRRAECEVQNDDRTRRRSITAAIFARAWLRQHTASTPRVPHPSYPHTRIPSAATTRPPPRMPPSLERERLPWSRLVLAAAPPSFAAAAAAPSPSRRCNHCAPLAAPFASAPPRTRCTPVPRRRVREYDFTPVPIQAQSVLFSTLCGTWNRTFESAAGSTFKCKRAVNMTTSDDESGSGLHSGAGCVPEGTAQGALATAEGSRAGCASRREERARAWGSAQATATGFGATRCFTPRPEVPAVPVEHPRKLCLTPLPPPAHALLRIRPCMSSTSCNEGRARQRSFMAW
ncbi:hypothetical protein DFH09DRAFT_1365716 [Mycena vulgaris]|nr:hypothetical protein DFH09DRAFT_1365716 [Mycena vulgaris]